MTIGIDHVMKTPRGRPHRCVDCDEILRLCRDGMPVTEIAASLRRETGWVYGILRRHGVDPVPPVHPRASPAEILSLFQDGKALADIGRKVRISRERVRQILVKSGIAHPDRRTGHHVCTDACQAAQTSAPLMPLLALAKQTSISLTRLKWATRVHHVKPFRTPRRHRCDIRCETFRLALVAGESASEAARRTGWPTNTGPGRLRIYHPDWPWPVGYPVRKPMRAARGLLVRFIAVCRAHDDAHDIVAAAEKFLA